MADEFRLARVSDDRRALGELEIGVSSEALYRSAVSRAYYACFGAVRSRASVLRAATRRSAAEHGELASFYAKRFGEAGEQIGALLSRMRTFRNAADYDATLEDAGAICEVALKDARIPPTPRLPLTLFRRYNPYCNAEKGLCLASRAASAQAK